MPRVVWGLAKPTSACAVAVAPTPNDISQPGLGVSREWRSGWPGKLKTASPFGRQRDGCVPAGSTSRRSHHRDRQLAALSLPN